MGFGLQIENYRSGGLRRTRSVRRYTDRLIRARVAAAMAPAHQYQPPSVTAATIKPAASKTSVKASPSRHHRGNPELTLWSVIGPSTMAGVLGVTPDPAARSERPAETYGSEGRVAAAKTTRSTLGPLTPSQAVTNAVVVSVASFLPVPRGVRPGDCAYSGRREPQ
jgi:hypothetical protein